MKMKKIKRFFFLFDWYNRYKTVLPDKDDTINNSALANLLIDILNDMEFL